ncbi:hypothetical protein TNCV_261621 [Trichonephila clavipes]|nr:hypothetical protein TNCV_261621 [Trichonephila clavipes]
MKTAMLEKGCDKNEMRPSTSVQMVHFLKRPWWPACHEFKPGAAEDRNVGKRYTLYLSKLKRHPVGVV